MASETAVEDHYFKYSSAKYFRDSAEDALPGAYGRKHDGGVGPHAYLEKVNTVKKEYLAGKVHYETTATVDWKRESAAAVEAHGQVHYFVASGQEAVSGSYADVRDADVVLKKFRIDEGPLIKILNQDASGALKYLSDEGAKGRIVNQYWVGLAGEIKEQWNSALAAGRSVTATVEGATLVLGVQVKASSSEQSTIRVDPGATFAYALCKVSNWDDHRTKIAELEDDYYDWG